MKTRYLIEGLKGKEWVLYSSSLDYGFARLFMQEALDLERYKEVRIVEEKRKEIVRESA